MTAKHAVYLAITQDKFNLSELQAMHRSLQARRIGKSDYQIRFKDSEPWMNPEDWATNYRNSLLKQLGDLVAADLQVLPQEVILSQLPENSRKALQDDFIRRASEAGQLTTNEEFNEQLDKYDTLYKQASAINASLEKAKKAYTDSQNKVKRLNSQYSEYRQKVDEELSALINNASIVGTIKVSDLKEVYKRLGS
jgi:hypothetical protein